MTVVGGRRPSVCLIGVPSETAGFGSQTVCDTYNFLSFVLRASRFGCADNRLNRLARTHSFDIRDCGTAIELPAGTLKHFGAHFAIPDPLRGTCCGLPALESVIVRFAVNAFLACGLNAMLIPQFFPAGTTPKMLLVADVRGSMSPVSMNSPNRS